MLNTPFSPWPSYTPEEADAVSQVLLSNRVNYWTGELCRQFEKDFAQWSDSQYAIALANGTLALELALKVLNIGPGDEVIVTPRTFIASISCVVTLGATPVFADIDGYSQNISANTISDKITAKTKAVICVHLAGYPCDMDPIMALAKQHRFYVIEDCAQAHGARYKGRSVGSIGHIGAWSFCQDKIITTGGEGGMLTTNDHQLWDKMWSYKDHGKTWQAIYERQHPPGFRWVHDRFGSNYRMTEMQAAIGLIQLKRMKDWTSTRQKHAQAIWQAAAQLPAVQLPESNEQVENACYKCYLFIRPEKLKPDWNRNRIIEAINTAGVPCYSGSCGEVYLEKAFDNTPWRPKTRLAQAQLLAETSLMFLVHPTLTQAEIEKTISVMTTIIKEASQ
jgi:dTDP-4-amino-4,6-dideoxygalactose transaminase